MLSDIFHLRQTLLLERRIAYRKDLVDNEYLRIEVRRHREGEPQIHSARITFHRRIDELRDAREVDDLVEASRDLLAAHSENRAIQVDVVAPRELWVKARSDLEQRSKPPMHLGAPRCRLRDAREDLEQCALAGTVAANQPDDLALLDVEGHAAQRQKVLGVASSLLRPVRPHHRSYSARRRARRMRDRVTQRGVTPGRLSGSVS